MPKKEILTIGGQAVIEGVMMRTKETAAVAVRNPKGKIQITKYRIKHGKIAGKIIGIPFVRGTVFMAQTLSLGFKAINYSAAISSGEKDEKMDAKSMALILLISIGFAAGLFVVLPLILTHFAVRSQGILFNVVDGIIRIAVFIIYLLLISSFKDIRTLFQYHGAEHMTVAAYEKKEQLNIKSIRKYSTLHPRCGTAFLFIVLIVSILVFSLVTSPSLLVKLLSRVILLPVIAGVSYEILKFGGKHHENFFVGLLVYPGLLLQEITTKKPTNKQIEVAIASLKAALK